MDALKNNSYAAVVIGGVNTDICGKPNKRTVKRDSNPGVISTCPGGVGRNIAHNLRILGVDVSLISAIGGDVYGKTLLESCEGLGIDTSMCGIFHDERSSTYMYITDESGEMQLAVADMDITKRITPEFIAQYIDVINSFGAVVLDANLESETLEYCARHITAPMYADPVSTAKAPRLINIVSSLTAIKPNLIEAQTLTGKIWPEDCARALDAKRVFISLGSEGLLAREGERLIKLPCERCRIVNTTGAGDAVMAAIIWAGLNGLSLEKTAQCCIQAGMITCLSSQSNSEKLVRITEKGGRNG